LRHHGPSRQFCTEAQYETPVSTPEKLQLFEELWDHLTANPEYPKSRIGMVTEWINDTQLLLDDSAILEIFAP
jgi:hypothetical protein